MSTLFNKIFKFILQLLLLGLLYLFRLCFYPETAQSSRLYCGYVFFARMCRKQGINLSAGGCKITSIPVNLGNLDIFIATKWQIT